MSLFAERLAAAVLEKELVRVCAQCEKEHGPVKLGPDQMPTHGLCRRHMVAAYSDPAVPALRAMLPSIMARPDEYFAPDLGQAKSGSGV